MRNLIINIILDIILVILQCLNYILLPAWGFSFIFEIIIGAKFRVNQMNATDMELFRYDSGLEEYDFKPKKKYQIYVNKEYITMKRHAAISPKVVLEQSNVLWKKNLAAGEYLEGLDLKFNMKNREHYVIAYDSNGKTMYLVFSPLSPFEKFITPLALALHNTYDVDYAINYKEYCPYKVKSGMPEDKNDIIKL